MGQVIGEGTNLQGVGYVDAGELVHAQTILIDCFPGIHGLTPKKIGGFIIVGSWIL